MAHRHTDSIANSIASRHTHGVQFRFNPTGFRFLCLNMVDCMSHFTCVVSISGSQHARTYNESVALHIVPILIPLLISFSSIAMSCIKISPAASFFFARLLVMCNEIFIEYRLWSLVVSGILSNCHFRNSLRAIHTQQKQWQMCAEKSDHTKAKKKD